ncbi:hypothetical protein SAV14893_051390 [Streptomyces avermitilis]|uniref:Uncharacterized protein n=1 Tax=Streptomyces avermitilis TaxID=33903 RepID=A0A4D4M0A1_STRAX|nr:hypothetical protein SAVMC3_63710 [Streptomyces avermitilis]GDY65746.1 hypothetical protein SAV14893_051390 [Streptomyces avermitilis]GDY74036.1 hypothetical protein SAV31267_035210 [Streptomyces avermitilis]
MEVREPEIRGRCGLCHPITLSSDRALGEGFGSLALIGSARHFPWTGQQVGSPWHQMVLVTVTVGPGCPGLGR